MDLVKHLRSILAAQGIVTTISDEEPEDDDGDSRALQISKAPPGNIKSRPDRRVSFDDARLEETWLSERSQFGHTPLVSQPQGLLLQPARRGRDFGAAPRARSISSSNQRQPAPKHFQNGSPSSRNASELDDRQNPTLLFEVTETQLEQNADAFLATSELRAARQLLHVWHDQALAARSQRVQAWQFAENHDRRKLLKESLDTLVGVLVARKDERHRILQADRAEQALRARETEHIAQLEANADVRLRKHNKGLLEKAFSHWLESARYQKRVQEVVRVHILKTRYFNRWRAITADNIIKARSLLTRKFTRLWRDRTAHRALMYEQAAAHHEESLMKRFFQRWFWGFCSRRVVGWHEQSIKRRALTSWTSRLQGLWSAEDGADLFNGQKRAASALSALVQRYASVQANRLAAERHCNTKLISSCFQSFQIRAKHTPGAKAIATHVEVDLKRKALKVWQLHVTLSRQAVEVDRKRVLQSAWTNWNDALRCKALAQRMDERVLMENLYKWLLQTRLKDLQRKRDARMLRRVLHDWKEKLDSRTSTLQLARSSFAANQRWRVLRSGMVHLNMAVRVQEDAERLAIEFSNSRSLPHVLEAWKERTEHARSLIKWAMDARFYCLATRTLKIWRERTEQHKHSRRRDAYAQVRARVKIRLVRHCFDRWRTQSVTVHSMDSEAERRSQARLFNVGTAAFDRMREKTAACAELTAQAASMDREKLLGSALAALVNHHIDLGTMGREALHFRQESDMSLLASALKRIQWSTFTATRRAESADALWARNRDQHIRQMIRHLAARAAERRSARELPDRRDESPSLRPASRAAARSAERPNFPSSPPIVPTTPAYMRSPSRSRRAGRFKPLPPPAHVTPMAFEQSFFVTTPAPLAQGNLEEQAGEESDIFDGLTPQITPFARKLRAGGIRQTPSRPPFSALRSSVFGRSMAAPGGTAKSVRFAGSGSRFGGGRLRASPAEG